MYENRFQRFAPVKEGDEIDVKIEAIGEKGDGIAKKDGFVLIVPGTKKDDEVKVRITKVLRRVGFGEVVGGSKKPLKGKKESMPADEDEDMEDEPEEEMQEDAFEENQEEEESEEPPEDSEDFGEELEE